MGDTSTSSASSSTSESDAYNTESARLYFGPVNTPERKFVASKRLLFPPQVSQPLRRSPRLSSPRPRPPNTASIIDQDSVAQEANDIDLVAELVNDFQVEDDEKMSYPLVGTPPRTEDVEQDEPLSALADKILHAVDNPSPPPSPASASRMFDPYHPDSGEFEYDTSQEPTDQDILPLITLSDSGNTSKPPTALDPDLIVFDSPDPLPPFNHAEDSNVSHQPMTVDDLLTNSPDPIPLYQPILNHRPALLVDVPKCDIDVIMCVDSLNKSLGVGFDRRPSEVQPRQTLDETRPAVPVQQPGFVEDATVTPLRRSTRPRKSIAPVLSPRLTPPVVIADPSVARTAIKGKESLRLPDEDINFQEGQEKSPSKALPSTPRRSRSPSKEPFLFRRELGSLSPASASLLSSLAFNNLDIPGQQIGSSNWPTIETPQVLSFSAFAPVREVPDDVGTPVRTDGPKRVPSPQKVESSPHKFRLQSHAPNDPTNTPARRIPIEQAIAEGQLSPEKAARIGFKAANGNNTAQVVSTPARRVLIPEKHVTPGPKPILSRLESPVKQPATYKDSSVAPRHAFQSVKGKERAVAPAMQESSLLVKKYRTLPFPLIATTTESHAPPVDKNLPKQDSSSAKSTLKVASKIPRISKKPYARKVTGRSTRAASPPTSSQVDSGKSLPRPPPPSPTTQRLIRLAKSTKPPINTALRPTPTVSTTSTSSVLLKRKRENLSPSKAPSSALRQVPLSTNPRLSTNPKPQSTDFGPTPADQIQDTIVVRRVVTPPSKQPVLAPPHEHPATDDPRIQPKALEALPSLSLPPGSPMKQDHLEEQNAEPLDNMPSNSVSPSVPAEAPPPVFESESLGPRRTTRARKPVNPSLSIIARKSRRKVVNQFDDVFSGMSISALKELTMTNTEKNQHYLAAKLETEVVRKEGLRPESPAVKIRTISQREQDEKERQRAERARRRARRLGNEECSSDIEASSDVGYSSPTEIFENVDMDTSNDDGRGLPKHRRGAGDDEDYETPERPLRNVNVKARLLEDGSGNRQSDRRVKWDRGLFTLVYLDEVGLGSRQNLKENKTLKGILAPASKALRLDTLGNLLHTDTPLSDLVSENVTVKKFVYDNDVPASQPPAPKTTRSKSKRK